MATPDRLADALAAFQALLGKIPSPRPEDLYLERTAEGWWRTADGRVTEQGVARRDGVAVRRHGRLDSSDATDRVTLGRLLHASPHLIPPVPLPDPPPLPDPREWLARLGPGRWTFRWRWRWAAVVRSESKTILRRPVLLEVQAEDGQRALAVLPLPGDWQAPLPAMEGRGAPPRGRPLTLLAPPVAAALVHEVVGHALEGDLVAAGLSPFSGDARRLRFSLPLDVTDDPTRADLPGAFAVDDEGTPGRPRALLRGGRTAGVLADRATAARLGSPAGSARRGGVHTPPRPRISNLVTRGPGTPLAELRQQARVEVTSVHAAALDLATTTLRLEVRSAHALRGGEPDRPLPGFVLHAPLASICEGLLDCSGETRATAEPGWCRKDGDAVPVGGDTPWLLLDGLEAG